MTVETFFKKETVTVDFDKKGKYSLGIIYEDNHLLVVEKIPNVLSQADNTEDIDMISICREYLRVRYSKPGNVFTGLVHRLDRPVGGVMIFAKTSKSASRLSEQIRNRTMKKYYYAVVENKCEKHGSLSDYLYKDKKKNKVKVVNKNYEGAKDAKLKYDLIGFSKSENLSLVEIELETGRPHQIRVQFSSRKHPLWGDQRYNRNAVIGQQISLWSHKIIINHPTKKEPMEFVSEPDKSFPWNLFI